VSHDPGDPRWFRQVLGQYPTGVCVVTAARDGEAPVGMAVGSFTSVSLDPPLVAFLPDRNSSTWPRIEACGRFCVNILGAEQEQLCRRFASRVPDKYGDIPYRLSASGSPILENIVAWIDCELHSVMEAGDHYIVLGRVRELQLESGGLPLLFFQGGYGRFAPLSLAASDPLGIITSQLRYVDLARPAMERLASDLAARCIATVRAGDELVIGASAGSAHRHSVAALVGQRLPYAPPASSVFAAWATERESSEWLLRAPSPADAQAALATVHERGFSVGTMGVQDRRAELQEMDLRDLIQQLDYDPAVLGSDGQDIRLISAPVFAPNGEVVLAITLFEYPEPDSPAAIRRYIDALLNAAASATESIAAMLRAL
jgi:flavin reductase (DIM6/NTAB) family NADH-FMN oxidoreductase RutF/DNA-binding IclR family transcriptional regulator